jgi:hypothetical protein
MLVTYANRRATWFFFIETHHHMSFVFSTFESFFTVRQTRFQLRACLLYIPEQRSESFLFKVPVIREHVSQAFAPHRLHRNAVRQALTFIRTAIIER